MSLGLWFHPANLADCVWGIGIRFRRAARGCRVMAGAAEAVVEQGLDRCWTGRHLTASPSHFRTLWTRDPCFSSTSLARLGGRHRERLVASLAWALDGWERHDSHVTTTFHAWGIPADVYDYGIDSLPLLLAALRAVGPDGDELVRAHRPWLELEIGYFVETAIDRSTGLVRDDRKFSAHRDTVTNHSTAYGNAMVALLAKTLATKPEWNLPDPLASFFPDADFGRLLREDFWMGDRYRDSIGSDETSGEANIWPFWCGLETDHDMLAAALATLVREGYCDPYPLRYTTSSNPMREVWLVRHLLPNYQGNSVWISLGAIYVQLLRSVDPAASERETARYRSWIERDGTFWEVLNAVGHCWRGQAGLMLGEESMLWGAIFLDHLRRPQALPATL
jgi:hypothetical protein